MGHRHHSLAKVPRLTQLQPGYCTLGGTGTSGPYRVCAPRRCNRYCRIDAESTRRRPRQPRAGEIGGELTPDTTMIALAQS